MSSGVASALSEMTHCAVLHVPHAIRRAPDALRVEHTCLRLGPDHTLVGETVAIRSGPLSGTELRLDQEVSKHKAAFSLLSGPDVVARGLFDRDPSTGLETMWDIYVRPDHRRTGIASLLVRLSWRRLLGSGRRHWFFMRKLMQLHTAARLGHARPGRAKTELHNIGIGLIGVRIGMRPEPGLESMLSPDNIRSVQFVPPDSESPPGLLVHLHHLPGAVTVCRLDAQGAPVVRAEAYRTFVSPVELLRAARTGSAIIGNIDYILPAGNTRLLARHLADGHDELDSFTKTLDRAARKLGVRT